MKELLHTTALDVSETLVKPDDAEKGNSFVCPVCKTDMILRKSGKTGKGTKRPHFAHHALTENCTPESALHYSFKCLLAEKIKSHLQTSEPMPICWECDFCGEEHSGNLLKKVVGVKVECHLGDCQPDIVLFDAQNKPFAVIEVVVTHKPDENVLKFYRCNNIILLQINLTSESDIDCLNDKISRPDIVETCYNPRCGICGGFMQKKKMLVIDGPCWKCHRTMKIAVISTGIGGILKPSKFTDCDTSFAKSKGVLLKTRYSKTVAGKYTANTCGRCGAFAGDFFLFTEYIAPAGYGDLPEREFDMGFYCAKCEK